MQVFVVFTSSEFWGNKTKDIYLFMTELPGDSYCFIPQALGWSVNYCSGLANDLVPRVLKLDFLRRARTRLIEYSNPKLINNSWKENNNRKSLP